MSQRTKSNRNCGKCDYLIPTEALAKCIKSMQLHF